jgi:hypothetical protein
LAKKLPELLARLSQRLPVVLVESLNEITRLNERIAVIERLMGKWKKQDPTVKAISAILGVGRLTATTAVAVMGDAKAFRSGREFAAWTGLVPRQTDRWQDPPARHQQAGRHVSAHFVDTRGQKRVDARQETRPVGRTDQAAATA